MQFILTRLRSIVLIAVVSVTFIGVTIFHTDFKVQDRKPRWTIKTEGKQTIAESKIPENSPGLPNAKDKSTAAEKVASTGSETVRNLIAKSLSARTRIELNSRCPSYQEFRHLDFLHPVLKNKLCHNAEAYRLNSDGYPMCVLPNPFDEDMLNAIREGSDIADYTDMDNSKMQMFVFKGSEDASLRHKGGYRWEPRRIRWLLTFAKKLLSVTFIDIGCNLGVYTLEAAKLGLPTVSLDANIRNLLRLRLTLNAAKLDASLVWNFVSQDMSLKYLNFLGESHCSAGYAGKLPLDIVDTIPVMPLRSEKLASLIRSKMVVMKLDIEGGEIDFLMTSGRLFTDFKVAAVQMEWHPPFMRDKDSFRMAVFFTDRDYKPWRVPAMATLDVNKVGAWGSIDVLWVHRDFIGMM